MKVFKTVDSLKDADEIVAKEILGLIDNMTSEGDVFEPDYKTDESFFSYLFGGDVYVIETFDDLKKIDVLKSIDADGNVIDWLNAKAVRNANITEASDFFDAADYIAPEGKFVALFMATNNSGGNVYYIPRDIADQCSHVEETVRKSNDGGISYNSSRSEFKDQCRIEMPDGSIVRY